MYKTYISDFSYFENRIMPFCNLFIERPSYYVRYFKQDFLILHCLSQYQQWFATCGELCKPQSL